MKVWIPRNLVEIVILWQMLSVQYSTIQYNTVQYSIVQYSTVQHSIASRVQTPGPGQLFSVTAMLLLHRQFGGVKEKEEEKLPFCWLAPLRLAGCEQKSKHYSVSMNHW